MRSRSMHPSGFLRSCPGHLRSLIWKGKQPQRIQPALSILEPSFALLSSQFDSDNACISSVLENVSRTASSGALVRIAPAPLSGSFLRRLLHAGQFRVAIQTPRWLDRPKVSVPLLEWPARVSHPAANR